MQQAKLGKRHSAGGAVYLEGIEDGGWAGAARENILIGILQAHASEEFFSFVVIPRSTLACGQIERRLESIRRASICRGSQIELTPPSGTTWRGPTRKQIEPGRHNEEH